MVDRFVVLVSSTDCVCPVYQTFLGSGLEKVYLFVFCLGKALEIVKNANQLEIIIKAFLLRMFGTHYSGGRSSPGHRNNTAKKSMLFAINGRAQMDVSPPKAGYPR